MATGDTTSGWEKEWRNNVTEQLRAGAEAQQRVAVVLERITGQLEQHDRELDELRTQRSRENERESERTYASVEKVSEGWRNNLAIAISLGVGLIYLIGLLAQHWK